MLREDLGSFIARAFLTVNPGTPFLSNWHIELIADHLSRCESGELTRLIINMPPRALKSMCVSVAWPAWLLGRNPSQRIIAASYSQPLALKHSLDTRLILQSDWYRALFPETRLTGDQNRKEKFLTTRRGFRLATSVGGTLTGEGGNVLILDDPLNPLQAESRVRREAVNDWFRHTFLSRLDDKKRGVIVLVMQRLHPDDLTGVLTAEGEADGWDVLRLPAIADANHHFLLSGGRGHHWKHGELLHPGREGEAEIARAKRELGSHIFTAQYLQSPRPREGGMVKAAWLGRYDRLPEEEGFIHSWDTAIATGSTSDYSVCTIWQMVANGHALVHAFRDRLDYPDLRRSAIVLAERYPPMAVLIEDKASGQSLLQELRRTTRLPVIPIRPVLDKVTRFAAITPVIEAGRLLLPRRAAWLADLEEELLAFPAVSHDDQVDSIGQYLNWRIRKEGIGGVRIRGV